MSNSLVGNIHGTIIFLNLIFENLDKVIVSSEWDLAFPLDVVIGIN
jgi:hypothetical protein